MEKAYKLAVEKGYRSNDPMVLDGRYFNMVGDRILLDPEFWKSFVGKKQEKLYQINSQTELWINCNNKKITREEFKERTKTSFETYHKFHKKEIRLSIQELKRRQMTITYPQLPFKCPHYSII